MQKMTRFCICKCYFTDNYFITSIKLHLRYEYDEQFRRDYAEVLREKGAKIEDILAEIKEEKQRRCEVIEGFAGRRLLIESTYKPLHKDIFKLHERFFDKRFVELCRDVEAGDKAALAKYRIKQGARGLYQFPVFIEEFCAALAEEVANFRRTNLPRLRPNTMNYQGILLDEMGFTKFFDDLRTRYLNPLARIAFPEWTYEGLDSHRVFTVLYQAQPKDTRDPAQKQQRDLSVHFDNAEVTLNVSLNTEYEGGEIHFGNVRTGPTSVLNTGTQDVVIEHKFGWGIFHRGRQLHGALPIEQGWRENLIVWMRSSSIRNEQCPMCWKKPELIPVDEGYGDGFTESSNGL